MRIKVQFLGGSRSHTGTTEHDLDIDEGACIDDAMRLIAGEYPALTALLGRCRWARNLEFAERGEVLADGDELALLPPVSGGAGSAELTTEAIDPQSVVARVQDPRAGATVIFIGTVRDHSRGKSVQRLEYEAYPEMALRQLERIAERCSDPKTDTRVAVTHRTGLLGIGDAAVVIAASSAHRAEAFGACRDTIELLKEDVPIWKKETTSDGEEWVGLGS